MENMGTSTKIGSVVTAGFPFIPGGFNGGLRSDLADWRLHLGRIALRWNSVEVQVAARLVDAVEILRICKGEKFAFSVTQSLIRLGLCGCGGGNCGNNGQQQQWPVD